MPFFQDIALGRTWSEVDLVGFMLGPDLVPTAGTRLEGQVEVTGIVVIREIDNTTSVENFVTGFPLGQITKIEFTLK